ncbi:HAD-IB family hydrolase [Veronia nyctiphanis]|uniref:HAD-IB family hydrolase n=1 Tax=Veronia nyctiphanis TaxID=1278244 RepID=A0A4Q0YMD5_9GAMM|nr:HAD family hydrolase [Veronia nyctiphanis]RXJ71593.1 HAD-IB family hydrolase [Veronia nyctiphanis]
MTKKLYVFHLDETLIRTDCSVEWNQFLVEKGVVNDPNYLEEDRRLMAEYAAGNQNLDEYLTFALSPLVSMPTTDVSALVDECITTRIIPTVYPEAKALIDKLSEENTQMVIISASVSFLVEAIAEKLGLKNALGVDLEILNGCYTPKVRGVASYKEGKVARLKQWMESESIAVDEIHFYTDSINDLASCLYADHVYLVNPCAKLREFARNTDWTILPWGNA